MNATYRYVIKSPPFNPCSGGVRQLHYLAALLHSIDVPIAMTTQCFYCPILPIVERCNLNDIAIYPEIYPGNPLSARRVVHYALGFLGNLYRRAGGGVIPKTELLLLGMASMRQHGGFLLGEAARWYDGKLGGDNLHFIPCVSDGEWLYPETKTIKNLCYRGHRTCYDLPQLPDGATLIPTPTESSNPFVHRHRTLTLLRRAENFFTCDHYTVMTAEAERCGCRVFKVCSATSFETVKPYQSGLIMNPVIDQPRAADFHRAIQNFFVK